MSEKRPSEPAERHETVRAAIAAALREGPLTAREISERCQLREHDVPEHVEHLARSLRGSGERLVVTPARCIACGFEFAKRERASKPGKCPECKSGRIAPPSFAIEPA